MPFGPGVFLLYRKGVDMKIKVVERYVDKYTGQIIEPGTIIEHEPRRAEEIINNGKAKKFISEFKSAEK